MALSRRVLRDGRELRIHESLEELSTDLAEYIAELSEASVKERGVFSIALSGGSLIALMRKLREAPYKTTVDWARWHIFWCDERMVSKSHADSNYKLARDELLCKVPIVPSHVHSINNALSAEDVANDYEFVIRQLVRNRVVAASDINDCPKFDLILLGMGSDGHVASLFPEHEALTNKDEWVTFIADSPEPPPERITFTLPVINSASNVAMAVAGANKADAVNAVMSSSSAAPDCASLPAKMISPTQGKLVLFLDREAASKMRGSQIK